MKPSDELIERRSQITRRHLYREVVRRNWQRDHAGERNVYLDDVEPPIYDECSAIPIDTPLAFHPSLMPGVR